MGWGLWEASHDCDAPGEEVIAADEVLAHPRMLVVVQPGRFGRELLGQLFALELAALGLPAGLTSLRP